MRPLRWLPGLLWLLSPLLHAQITQQDWVGTFALNQDGHPATLTIIASKNKCAPAARCSGLQAQYTAQAGGSYQVMPTFLDGNAQHLTVIFPISGTPQRFDLYLFTADRNRLAGTTSTGGPTFGVEGLRSGAPSGSPQSKGTKTTGTATLSADGTVILQQSDGSTRSIQKNGCSTVRSSDGQVRRPGCAQRMSVQTLQLPDPPSDSAEAKWLSDQDVQSTTILQDLLGGAQSASYRNYLQNFENGVPSLYARIATRLQMIDTLTNSN